MSRCFLRWHHGVSDRYRRGLHHNWCVPFTCEACGGWSDLIPAVGVVLQCPHCRHERPFARPPLLVVTGTSGVGKSTLCARLAGTIPGAVLLDADVHAEDLVSVVPPNQDYLAFWRSMMRLAHEIAQNNVVVVYFSVMLPEQILGNVEVLDYFDSVHFLCLTCPPDVLRARHDGRVPLTPRIQRWVDFNGALMAAAREVRTATVVDASRTVDQLEQDVRHWIKARGWGGLS